MTNSPHIPRPPFEAVVERHGQAVLRFCVARLGLDRGEEAFQETLLAALRNYGELREPAAVAGWLFAIAQRKVVDVARSTASARTVGDELLEHVAAPADPEPPTGIWKLVALLPPRQREAVGLRYLADLSHADIAEAMGTTEDAARRNVFEGLRRLRKDLSDDLHHD